MKTIITTLAAVLLLAACSTIFPPGAVFADEVKNTEIPLCPESWISGPFYLTVCGWWECPTWYPPNHVILIEHCPANGLIRIPKEYRSEKGSYIEFNKQQNASEEEETK